MQKYVADIYQKNIYTIDYNKLKKNGIKCLLYDFDNTLTPPSIKEPTKKIIDFFDELKKMGFKIIIFSNSPRKKIEKFKNTLDVDCLTSAKKPFKGSFLKILNKYDYKISEVAIIGDQILTDIIGGNKVGITTILVNPISVKEPIYTKFNRLREKRVFKKLQANNLFIKGRYYE